MTQDFGVKILNRQNFDKGNRGTDKILTRGTGNRTGKKFSMNKQKREQGNRQNREQGNAKRNRTGNRGTLFKLFRSGCWLFPLLAVLLAVLAVPVAFCCLFWLLAVVPVLAVVP